MNKMISSKDLDEKLMIFFDTKKTLTYDKHQGKWGWNNRDEIPAMMFDSALEAIDDAISPYIDNEEDTADECPYCGQNCHTDGGQGCDEWNGGGFSRTHTKFMEDERGA